MCSLRSFDHFLYSSDLALIALKTQKLTGQHAEGLGKAELAGI
jgi:hypothetical protein